jgi:hypothetical protein
MIGLKEIKLSVCGQQSIPVSVLCSSAEEEFNFYSGQFHFSLPIIAVQTTAVPNILSCFKQFYQFLCTNELSFKSVPGPGHLDHPKVMASDMPGFDEPDDISACKPTVSQKIIKAYTFPDSIPDHIYSLLNFVLSVLTNAFRYCFCFFALPGVLFFTLLPCHPKWLIRPAPFFSMKREVKNSLGLSVCAAKKKSLETKY